MQRMIIMGLSKFHRKIAKTLYNTLPNTLVKEIGSTLIVETEITEEDKIEITEQYNKTGNTVVFEDI